MNPTIREITEALKWAGKPMARNSLYVHLAKLRIRPLGARQRPQRFATDVIPRLLNYFGLRQPATTANDASGILPLKEIKLRAKAANAAEHFRKLVHPLESTRPAVGILSLAQIKRRAKGKGKSNGH